MKVHLMFSDRDFDIHQESPWNEGEIIQDLELSTLLNVMSQGEKFIFGILKTSLLDSLTEIDPILYRQEILRDCLENPEIIRKLYRVTLDLVERKKKHWYGIFSRFPTGILSSAIEMMQVLLESVKELKELAETHAGKFQSRGLVNFFNMIIEELNDDYFQLIKEQLDAMKFKEGILLSVQLGKGNEGYGYILRKPFPDTRNWLVRKLIPKNTSYSFMIHPRDEHSGRALAEIRDRGINLIANAVAQSADHIDNFFEMLRIELSFYIGCLNLLEQLQKIEEPVCFPKPIPLVQKELYTKGLYDPCLALTVNRKIVSNEVMTSGKKMVIVTGANQGGKSTFIRSVGLAQIMMQCGMFVPADEYRANLCDGIFTHFKREEDTSMKSGKLDEELLRMNQLVPHLRPYSMVIFNESFSATNELEGSEIAWQISRALLEADIYIFFVTHLFEFAYRWYEKKGEDAFFLQAERLPDGQRTFKLKEAEPLHTSFGKDLYRKLFISPE